MNNRQTEKLTVYSKWCKGCGICVEFCPTGTLQLEAGKIHIARPEKCVKCHSCEKLCPDFAIYFTGEDVGNNS